MLGKEHRDAAAPPVGDPFWAVGLADLLAGLRTTPEGLSEGEAAERLRTYGPNRLEARRGRGTLGLLLSQFRSPIVLLLLFAAGLSYFLGEAVDASIILIIVLASGLLGFWQEKGAADAVEGLLAVVQVRATALRGRFETEVQEEPLSIGCCGAAGDAAMEVFAAKDAIEHYETANRRGLATLSQRPGARLPGRRSPSDGRGEPGCKR